MVRGVALNQVDTMWSHKLQRVVPIPKKHPIRDLIRLPQGFDRDAFDPARPETFVDSVYNQLPLCELDHRGRHEESIASGPSRHFSSRALCIRPTNSGHFTRSSHVHGTYQRRPDRIGCRSRSHG
ncbi:hypothetical protein [Paraburkholderia sp.]|uniref:hypothetical protein n=1 Tax=Paraburkholderia sp. TaxID=1926495 RepID=UPI0025E0BA2B|nr:hypothetical protein [Paraburkholderia sp.]